MTDKRVRDWVKEYYGKLLTGSEDLKTNACCATGAPAPWLQRLLDDVHPDVLARFYGCGFPIPEALEGRTVLDLGCGTGRDVFMLAKLVGPNGHVHGVDMTESQLQVARDTLGWHMDRFGHTAPNVSLHQGYIEDLSSLAIEPGTVDVIVSNCVVNLSPRKDLVLSEAARMLTSGGEVYFSDVFVDRRLPEELAQDPVLHSECLGGALYLPDFLSMARTAGFADPRTVSTHPITIENDEIAAKIGAARFYSVTVRLLALASLEERCEDYGQLATYHGTMAHVGPLFRLDDHHLFEAGRPERVCGNTADMLSGTRFGEHFTVVGDKSVHYGAFDCGATMAHDQYGDVETSAGADASAGSSSSSCC